jgi:hypothetical protein
MAYFPQASIGAHRIPLASRIAQGGPKDFGGHFRAQVDGDLKSGTRARESSWAMAAGSIPEAIEAAIDHGCPRARDAAARELLRQKIDPIECPDAEHTPKYEPDRLRVLLVTSIYLRCLPGPYGS